MSPASRRTSLTWPQATGVAGLWGQTRTRTATALSTGVPGAAPWVRLELCPSGVLGALGALRTLRALRTRRRRSRPGGAGGGDCWAENSRGAVPAKLLGAGPGAGGALPRPHPLTRANCGWGVGSRLPRPRRKDAGLPAPGSARGTPSAPRALRGAPSVPAHVCPALLLPG